MKKLLLIITIILITIPIIIAFSSSSSLNWLSRQFADTLYCSITGNCLDMDAETPFYINVESCMETPCIINASQFSENNYTIRARPGRQFLWSSEP